MALSDQFKHELSTSELLTLLSRLCVTLGTFMVYSENCLQSTNEITWFCVGCMWGGVVRTCNAKMIGRDVAVVRIQDSPASSNLELLGS